MKKILILLLLNFGFANAQILTIPDANFKNKLVNTLCVDTNNDGYGDVDVDTNNDGEIQNSEAEAVLKLDISFPNFTPISDQISDLTGINSFINLEILESRNNNLGSLDLTGLPNLKTISCVSCNIFALNITGLINLEFLYCDYNQISVLNLAGLNNLKSLSCYNNLLSALNLTGLTNLVGLECGNNNITSLNLSSTPNLVGLRCSNNLLNTLNINFLTNLSQLEYGNLGLNNVAINNLVNVQELFITGGIQNAINLNPLVGLNSLRITNTNFIEIDVSSLQYLNRFYAYSNYSLNNVNIKNGNNFNPAAGGNGIYIENNPNLNFICADEDNIVYINEQLATQNNTTTQVNSYCNFTPGGDYNTITGSLTFDATNNGCEVSDPVQPNIKITINDGANQGATFTSNSGNYTFYTETGNYSVTPDIENPSFFNFTPPTATANFPDNNNNIFTQDFCITANGVHPDLEIVIMPIVPAMPGFNAVYKIVYRNKGNQIMTLQYGVKFFYDHNLMTFIESVPTVSTQSTGALNWDYDNLMPFESRSITVTMNVNAPTAPNPVNIDDVLTLTAVVSPQAGDENVNDNTFQFEQVVTGSYDPNDMTCIEGDVVSPTQIGQYLHYVINFENTGSAAAQNIVVSSLIDPAQFDLSSLRILNSSHDLQAKVQGNKVEFIFDGINLGIGGHGNILLKIKSDSSLGTDDMVTNKADIFFDYNFPIETNDANTTFQALGVSNPALEKVISVYPNPTSGLVNIQSAIAISSVALYDIQGRLLQTGIMRGNDLTIDLSMRSKGIYFLKITTDSGVKIQKVVRE